LKKKKKCEILPPLWLAEDFLSLILAEEKEDANAFSNLPFHYVEISTLLLTEYDCFFLLN
jgi:GINS complex subunit 2